ncbi:hypothetical protein FJT64_022539 [Amphibalanus amphitrite]|uniref:Uncharacterized protein n=1 Tax=Amphibalanus amphitrite TaxID=1232801 RepID=A0A6A4WUG5_AMPAM|nr:hypothetical protein FJT64_022539 [Amphibalanus amphitrite]
MSHEGQRLAGRDGALLNLKTLSERRDAALCKLAADILANPAHPLYPGEQLANVRRPLRRQRKFVVPRAKTERYEKSTVPVLIDLMNRM